MYEYLIALLVASLRLVQATNNVDCCSILSNSPLSSIISYPGSTTYNATQKSYWSLQESSLTPSCIISPRNAQDVAEAVKLLTTQSQSQSTENNNETSPCKFAIKGRTHAPAAGFANIQDGITIDMTTLNTTTLSSDQTILHVSGGASWLQIYDVLNATGLAVAGGRNGQVGVGGLLTGGGISHFTTRVGFACDNVANFEVVLASGDIVDANTSSNADLYRALKGGANNFGIVTRFDLETFSQGQIQVTSLVNSIDEREGVFKAFIDITTAPTFDENASLVMALIFNATSKEWTLTSSAVNTDISVQSSTFDELKNVPNLVNTTSIEWLADFANEAPTPPLNWLFWTGTYTASTSLLSEIFTTLNESLYGFNVPGGVTWSIAFEPLPTIIPSKSQAKGPNVLGLSPSDGNAFIVLISPLWPDSSSNEAVYAAARKAGEAVDDLARSMGMLHRWRYLNYAGVRQCPIESYGAANVAVLKEVSERYDPTGVFQRLVPGGFKLH